MADHLVIGCARAEQDALEITRYQSDNQLRLEIVSAEPDTKWIVLDRDTARDLFNHLGVWLHKAAPADEED